MFARQTRIQQLEKRIAGLETQLNSIARHLGIVPNPPRPSWERYSSPVNRMGIETMPTKIIPILKPDLQIARITIDQHSYVRSYRADGHQILKCSGPLADVVSWLPQRASHIRRWEQVETRISSPVAAPNTPLPEARSQII